MPRLSQLYTYPIKSCGGLSHRQINLEERGPAWDRQWMVVDAETAFLTQRELRAMALIQPAFDSDALWLSAPGMPDIAIPLRPDPSLLCRTVRVWRDYCQAWDEGDDLAAWLSDYLHQSVRLVRMVDDFVRPVDPTYAPRPARTAFADAFPLLVVSEASLEDLNRRLIQRGSMPVPIQRFRPNLVIADCDSFAEDTWQTIQVGSVQIDLVKPCARCVLTTVDPGTGTIPDPAEPLATLNTFRKQGSKVMFAQNGVHRSPGMLAVGDPVSIIEDK